MAELIEGIESSAPEPTPTPAAPAAPVSPTPAVDKRKDAIAFINSGFKKMGNDHHASLLKRKAAIDYINSGFKKMQQPAAPAALAADNLAKIEDNPVDPKTGKGEGTYAINVNGKVKQVPFSKVPHVAAIAPMMTIGATTFANEADERRYIKDLYAADETARHEAYNTSDRWDMQASPPASAEKTPEPIHESPWWRRTKKAGRVASDIVFGGGGVATPPGFAAAIEGTELDPMVMARKQAAEGNSQAQQFLGGIQQDQKVFDTALVQPSESRAFQSVFDPKSKNWFSRFTTHTVKAIENQTSIENLYTLASMEVLPHPVGRVVGAEYQGQLITSGVSGVIEATKSTAKGEEDSADKWGDLFGNALVVVGMHYGHKGIEEFRQRDTTATLNDKAQEMHGKKFGSLDDNQKMGVLYASIEDANLKFKKRIDLEVDKMNARRKPPVYSKDAVDKAIQEGAGQIFARTSEEVRQQRLEAAKKLVRELVVRRAREEAYRAQMAQREHEARQAMDAEAAAATAAAEASRVQGEKDRAAEAAISQPSLAEQRGFGVDEGRVAQLLPNRGVIMTDERNSDRHYPNDQAPATGIPIVERRAAAGTTVPEITAKVMAAESKVNEIVEQETGTSFASKSVAGQRNAASWLEKNHPAEWEAFQGTPAYQQYVARVRATDMADASMKPYLERNSEGSGGPLNPGADEHQGVAQLILARTDIDAILKEKPEVGRALNEHAEKTTGRSFDSQDAGGRVAVLASFLKLDEKNLLPFITDDVRRRLATGQHIDLANMDAAARVRQRAEVSMSQRDAIRRVLDGNMAAHAVEEARKTQQQDFEDALMAASREGHSVSLDGVADASKGIYAEAAQLGLGKAEMPGDLSSIEKAILSAPEKNRTPAMNEFLTRMNRIRAAAEDHVVREMAEATARKLRDGTSGARQYTAKEVFFFSDSAMRLQREANDLRAEGRNAEADALMRLVLMNTRKADAITAAVQETVNPAPKPPVAKPATPMILGKATRVVTPFTAEGHPAHYVIIPIGGSRTSHDPLTFEYTPGYNQNGQPRNYRTNEQAQARLEINAPKLDPSQLLSNSPQLMDGPSLLAMTPDAAGNHTILDTIGGNFRAMLEERARRMHPESYRAFVEERAARLEGFGFNPTEVTARFGEHFELRRLLDKPVTDPIEWASQGMEFNRGPMGGLNDTEVGMAMSRLLSPEHIDRLDAILESLPQFDKKTNKPLTAREAMRFRSEDIVKVMMDSGMISPNERAEFVHQDGDKKGELTAAGKNLFESMLTSMAVSDTATLKGADVLGEASPSMKDKLLRASIAFLRMRNRGPEWDLASINTSAVDLIARAQEAAARLQGLALKPDAPAGVGKSLVERYLHGENYMDANEFGIVQGNLGIVDFHGQALGEPVSAAVEAMARALEEPEREFASMMMKFAQLAGAAGPEQLGLAGLIPEVIHPADAFTDAIANKYKGGNGKPLRVLPEEWGTVNGLPEPVKAAIEEGRGPLPVEPSVHAETVVDDVHPDSSSVTDVIPEGPKTVQELRKALENHPNYTPEQAAAATDMLEGILPRAMGVSLSDLLGNRRLHFAVGGTEPAPEGYVVNGYHQIIGEGLDLIRLCDTAKPHTFIEEVAHYLRRYLNPGDQATGNRFVGFKPEASRTFSDIDEARTFADKNSGKSGKWDVIESGGKFIVQKGWSEHQEELFADAFKRYHYDGGMRKGVLKDVFKTLARAMQSIYTAATSKRLAKGSEELNAMFDKWYDWETTERKSVNRINVDESGKLIVPPKAITIESSVKKPSPGAQVFVKIDVKDAGRFVKEKNIESYEMHQVPGGDGTVYVVADAPKGTTLYQLGLDQTLELAKKSRDYEAQFKREDDPRRKAWLRAQLNDIDDKLRGSTGLIGGNPEPKDTSVIQLVHGLSERPSIKEPTTPAQAVTEQQIHGDPTAISLGGKNVRPGSVSDETSGNGKPAGIDEVHAGTRPSEQGHEATGGKRGTGAIAKPESHPFAKVKAAPLEAPSRPRGTPVVNPDVWRGHVEALGLPKGTPPPTLRIDPDVREILIFPGQPEAVEGALSALQQYDGTVLASPAGTGKNYMLSAMANHLLGANGDAVGLWVTRSQNLIHDAGNMKDVARMFGIDVEELPANMADIQTGLYAATYHGITGNRHLLSVPWDFVIFDECDAAAKWTQSDRGKATINLGRVAKKVVYSSATPYAKTLEIGYMERLGLWKPGGFAKFGQDFNLIQVGPNEYSGGYAPRKLEKLRQQIVERGQWQQIHKDFEGVSAHVALIPQSEEVRAGVKNIRKAFAEARSGFKRQKMPGLIKSAAGHEAIYLKRYLEAAKLPHAIELGKKAIADGWKPVFFTEYRSPAEEGMEFINALGDEGRAINAKLPPLPDIVKELRAAFGDKIGIFAGAANQLRGEELEAFQSGEKDALYATYAAGGVGASAHDLVGDMPRMGVFISLPWAPRMLEQATNRTDRYGRQSEVANVFLTTDALPEVKLLGSKVLPRMAALKAAVFGVVNETSLSKNLREATGLPQELLEYDQGQEYVPQSGDFEHTSDAAKFTLLSDFEMPKAKNAKNKPMKYKGQGKTLYQMDKEGGDEDPFRDASQAAWDGIRERIDKMPAPLARAVTSNERVFKFAAEDAGKRAMGSGEPVKAAAERKMRDLIIDTELYRDAFIKADDFKDNSRAAAKAAGEVAHMMAASGDNFIKYIYKRAGLEEDGIEMARRLIETQNLQYNYQGRLQSVLHGIIHGKGWTSLLNPKDIVQMSKVVENRSFPGYKYDPQWHVDHPEIPEKTFKAAIEFRNMMKDIRKALADAGCKVVIYKDGKREEKPYKAIEDDPYYWPRMYDWNKKFAIKNPGTGKMTLTTLAEIMNMPTSDESRAKMIDQFAAERGISKMEAQAFFARNDRGIRLAGNVERAREWNISVYGRDRQAIERYVEQVSRTLAITDVHGQFREKTDPLIEKLPSRDAEIVNRIVTNDLDPSHMPKGDRVILSAANQIIIPFHMLFSVGKGSTHIFKTSLATNTRSTIAGIFHGITHPVELIERARDAGAILDYNKSAWMREYGLKGGGLSERFLNLTGFTPMIQMTRTMSSAAGRHFFERYAYPDLKEMYHLNQKANAGMSEGSKVAVSSAKYEVLRRKLRNLYGFSDEHLDSIAKDGYTADDVRRMEVGAANWVTGGNRASEMPAMFRPRKDADVLDHHGATGIRLTQMLHGFMFKSCNFINLAVFEELKHSDWKSAEPYHLITRFALNAGMAGFAIEQMLHLLHTLQGSPEADIEKRRHEWLLAHPISKEALEFSIANIAVAVGVHPLADLFTEMATHNPKDRQKLSTQHRFSKGIMETALGIPGQSISDILTAFEDAVNVGADTGHHKLSKSDRVNNIWKRLLNEEVVGSTLIVKPKKAPEHHGRTKKPKKMF